MVDVKKKTQTPLTAKYGDVVFSYQSHSHSGGHRVNVIDYPESSQHDLEDMGPRNESIQVAGYVIGNNYKAQKKALIDELRDSAPKTLVLPEEIRDSTSVNLVANSTVSYRVKCTDWSTNETKEERRIVRFNMTFQIKEIIEVIKVDSSRRKIFDKKKTLLEEITNWFEEAYDISQKPVTAINNVTSTVDKALDVIRAAKKVTGSISDFQRSVDELKGRATALTLNARAMAQDIGALVSYGTDPDNNGVYSGGTGSAVTVDTSDENNITSVNLNDTGAEQKREAVDLQDKMLSPLVPGAQEPSPLVQRMIRLQAIAAETGLFAVSEFDSPSQALSEERDLISRYDDLLDSIDTNDGLSDELYYAIRDAQQALHEDLDQRIVRLPRLVVKKNDAERNALELNYSTYGNMDEYEAFNSRNGIVHPAFIPALIDLEYKVGGEDE